MGEKCIGFVWDQILKLVFLNSKDAKKLGKENLGHTTEDLLILLIVSLLLQVLDNLKPVLNLNFQIYLNITLPVLTWVLASKHISVIYIFTEDNLGSNSVFLPKCLLVSCWFLNRSNEWNSFPEFTYILKIAKPSRKNFGMRSSKQIIPIISHQLV